MMDNPLPRVPICAFNPGSAAEELATDDWFFRQVDQEQGTSGVLRIWELRKYAVILGRGSRLSEEVESTAVQLDDIPVLRRTSGGAAIVAGPGCLMYSLIVNSTGDSGHLRHIRTVHRVILERLIQEFAKQGLAAEFAGTSDLAVRVSGQLKKISGNSMKLGKRALLYHGTLLYAMDLSVISRWLKLPPRTPDYRRQRTHGDFVTCISTDREVLAGCVMSAFGSQSQVAAPPTDKIQQLVLARFGNRHWTQGNCTADSVSTETESNTQNWDLSGFA